MSPVLLLSLLPIMSWGDVPPKVDAWADYAVSTYFDQTVTALGEVLTFKSVHQRGLANSKNPEFIKMSAWFKQKSGELGLEFQDHGEVVVIALGNGPDRLGIVTHADVQPAGKAKPDGPWAQNPFSLDIKSEPGRLVGRGVEDDKGPIITAMYAMKALKDKGAPLKRRVELIISYTEESDWAPFTAFLEANPPPPINVAIDAEYPTVVAEKGFGGILVNFKPTADAANSGTRLTQFFGGAFLTQVPETATAVIAEADDTLLQKLKQATAHPILEAVSFTFEKDADTLTINATGKSTHSSKPQDGVNAVTHLAHLLGTHSWPRNRESLMVAFINDLVGTGHHAERYGNLAYKDDFMGHLTMSLGYVKQAEDTLNLGINTRAPYGRSAETVKAEMNRVFEAWRDKHKALIEVVRIDSSEPFKRKDAPHVPVLLDIFSHYTGQKDVKPISIGGGTHARLVPGGVNFGPAMPDVPYTGHSEHEFMSVEQYRLNLRMYTAMIAMLATD